MGVQTVKLVTLGAPDSGGILSVPTEKMNDVEAGIQFLAAFGTLYPGRSLLDVASRNQGFVPLNGWLTNISKAVKKTVSSTYDGIKTVVGDVAEGTGNALKSTVKVTGGAAGSAVRLASDPEVLDAAGRIGTAYVSGGGSEGIRALAGGGEDGNALLGFLANLGQSWKGAEAAQGTQVAAFGGVSEKTLLWGGAALGGVVLLSLLLGRR